MAAQIIAVIVRNELTKLSKYPKEKFEKCYDKEGYTPLTYCCKNRKIEAMLVLLNAEINPDELDFNGMSALHHAAAEGYEDIAQLLINMKARLNRLCRHQNTALHFAVQNNRLSMVRYILSLLGANPQINFENMSGKTPLGIAKEKGFDDIACLLTKSNSENHHYTDIYEDGNPHSIENLVNRVNKLEVENTDLRQSLKRMTEYFENRTSKINEINEKMNVIMRTPKAYSYPGVKVTEPHVNHAGHCSTPVTRDEFGILKSQSTSTYNIHMKHQIREMAICTLAYHLKDYVMVMRTLMVLTSKCESEITLKKF